MDTGALIASIRNTFLRITVYVIKFDKHDKTFDKPHVILFATCTIKQNKTFT